MPSFSWTGELEPGWRGGHPGRVQWNCRRPVVRCIVSSHHSVAADTCEFLTLVSCGRNVSCSCPARVLRVSCNSCDVSGARIGRRPLFLASSILVTICLVLIGISFQEMWETATVLFWLCMFMFTFSLGLGPVTFVVASEVGVWPLVGPGWLQGLRERSVVRVNRTSEL